MDQQDSERLEQIRQQFNFGPYPRVPIETSPQQFPSSLYNESMVTAYYHRNRKVIDPAGKTILDVGCGTGYSSLFLAEANPGAKIIGFDISEKSIELARQRLVFHGFDDAEFHVLSVESLPSLGLHFDYINCDEVLYLLPQIDISLEIIKSVLKDDGIIRANLHNQTQRSVFYDAQALFGLLGITKNNPENTEIEIVKDFMNSLKERVTLKTRTWQPILKLGDKEQEEAILSNYLIQGDRGFTMPQLLKLLKNTGLELIDMVNWQQWDLMNLFEEFDNLPIFLGLALSEATLEERLLMFNLLHPIHRLLDFWCGHPHENQSCLPISEWTDADWETCRVHLHPQLKTPRVAERVTECLREHRLFPIGELLPIAGQESMSMESTFTACIMPLLLESSQTLLSFVERWQQIRPLNLETLEPVTTQEVLAILQNALIGLEAGGYVLLEKI